jgi:hypothetical protein
MCKHALLAFFVMRRWWMAANGQEQAGRFTQLVELMRDSVITQAAVTIIVMAAVVGLLWEGRTVPGELWALCGLVTGFYFGGKVQSTANRIATKQRRLDGGRGAEILRFPSPHEWGADAG